VSGHDPTKRHATVIVVLDSEIFQATLDESGYRAADAKYPDDAFVFAGYIGKVVDWENLGHVWQLLVVKFPELQDAEFVKALMRWTGPKSDHRAVALMDAVVENRNLGSVRWILPYREFRSALPAGGDDMLYFFGWFAVLTRLLGLIRLVPRVTLQLFYDENVHEEKRLQDGYEQFRSFVERKRPDVMSMLPYRPQPKSGRDFWPIRAADALAWNAHRDYIRTAKGKSHSNALWNLLDSGPQAFKDLYTAKDLREVLAQEHE
jgi:hypothetical protein